MPELFICGHLIKKDDATLGDLVGMMGGLMAAFAPPEQRAGEVRTLKCFTLQINFRNWKANE